MNKFNKTALFSLYDLKNAVNYAKKLQELGWKIVTTKETLTILKKHKIKAINISKYLKTEDKYPFPPTLHPMMELALTGNDKNTRIDLVYDITYPLSAGNDVGGNTLLGLASKGNRIVAFNNTDMERIIHELKENNNDITARLRNELIGKAYEKISNHYLSLFNKYHKTIFKIKNEKIIKLLEGENPYQVPAYLVCKESADKLGLCKFQRTAGDFPCYTNIADFDSILQIMCSINKAFYKYYKKIPYIVIASKHGNPCGLSIDWKSKEIAIEKALFGNPLAIWGGEVIVNFAVSEAIAKILHSSKKRERIMNNSKWMLDLIIAPDFENKAIEILSLNKRRKLFKNKALEKNFINPEKWSYRFVRGGMLKQPPSDYILDLRSVPINFSKPKPNYIDSLIISWAASWFSNHGGNEIAIAKNRQLIGVGGGPSTVNACKTAILRAKECRHNLNESVFVADAFFPFIDVPKLLADAGCAYGIAPKGGKKYERVKEIFKKNRIKMFYLDEKYRGFCKH